MNDENMRDLAAVRYDKARELLTDAESLLERDSYSSANNRAFYNQTEIPYGLKYGADHSCFQFYTIFLQIEEAGLLRQSITETVISVG